MTEGITDFRYRPPVSEADLAAEGFTAEEIARLNALREMYPMAEFITVDQRQKLVFLKWLRESGKFSETLP
jgi:hypothetical protein